MSKLNQIIAVEKGIKSKVTSHLTELYKAAQKPDLFTGFVKQWRKASEDVEDRPTERKKVQLRAEEMLREAASSLSELFDITATKDFANCNARANLCVDGKVLLTDVPATFLLFLEKQLTDMKTFVGSLPTLSTDDEWKFDDVLGMFKTDSQQTISTKKVQEALVLYPATPEHPAQCQVISKDVVAGYWDQVKQSGALVESRKKTLLDRIDTLLRAVKFAREEANNNKAEDKTVGSALFDYILS